MSDIIDDDIEPPPPRVLEAPERIWLVYGEIERDDTHAALSRSGEVSWCEDKQFDCDVEYVRADEIARLRAELAAVRAEKNEAFGALGERAGELRTVRAELAVVRADAERIDYIEQQARCDPKMDGQHVWWPTSFNHRLIGPTLREAIDAARGGQQ